MTPRLQNLGYFDAYPNMTTISGVEPPTDPLGAGDLPAELQLLGGHPKCEDMRVTVNEYGPLWRCPVKFAVKEPRCWSPRYEQ